MSEGDESLKRMIDWERSPFVLICPDAVRRHLAEPILRRMQENGFEPVFARLVWAGPEELDQLYKLNIDTVWETYRYRLLDQLFALGPNLVVLVEDQREAAPESHLRLKRLKGLNHPCRADIGTIRRDFRGVNSILGLIHTSDSPPEARREIAPFVGTLPEVQDDPETVWNLVRLTAVTSPKERREFDDVLGQMRAKIALAIWNEMTPAGHQLVGQWLKEGNKAFSATGAGAQLVAHLNQGANHPLAPVLHCEFQPEQGTMDGDRVRRLLASYQIGFDEWDHIVLATSSFFPTLRGD